MKDKVDITGMTWQEVVALVNCSKTTAKNALKRGYYVVNYKKRTCVPGPIDAEGCYKMAWFTFERFFRHHCPWNIAPDDCVQEAVLRLVENGERYQVPGASAEDHGQGAGHYRRDAGGGIIHHRGSSGLLFYWRQGDDLFGG